MSSKQERCERLLSAGYFPAEAPPPFTAANFAQHTDLLRKELRTLGDFVSECETYSVARVGHRRRTIKIPNPLSQLQLCDAIARHWPAIEKHLARSPLAFSTPRLKQNAEPEQRATNIPPFSELESERARRSPGYRYALMTDITQFFPSIYTHSLPWAVLGKPVAKAKIKAKESLGYSDELDQRIRNCQAKQTIGLPIGPDTSQVLAEIVGVGIDLLLHEELKAWPAGYRYVDDYALFFETRAQADLALSGLNKAVAEFELSLHEHKTRIVMLEALETGSWAHELRHFPFSHKRSRQIQEIHHFFQLSLAHAAQYPWESVMKFALRRIGSELIRKDNWPIFESYLLRTAQAYPDTLQLVSQFFYTYHLSMKYAIDRRALRRTLEAILTEHARYAHHTEIAWSLWIAIDNAVSLSSSCVQPIADLDSSVCALLALDLKARGQCEGKLDEQPWRDRCNDTSLSGPAWLLAYQAERGGLFAGQKSYVAAHDAFGPLLQRGVTFYDHEAHQSPLFEVKPEIDAKARKQILDMEENPNQHLTFKAVDEKYIDV